MATYKLISFIFFITIKVAFCTLESPNSSICRKSDSNFNECLKQHLQNVISNLGNDTENLKLSSLDPLVVNVVHLGDNYIKIRIRGLSTTKIEDFLIDTDVRKIYAETYTPAITAEAEFNSKEEISVVPIDNGKVEDATITDVRTVHIVQYEKYKKDDVEYYRVTDYKFIMNSKKAVEKFNGLLKDNDALVRNTIEKDTSAKDLIKAEYEKLIMKKINEILDKIPAKELYTTI